MQIKSFKTFLTEATIPQNIIDGFKAIAGTDGEITIYDLYNIQQSFMRGSNTYRQLCSFLFNSEVGSKFFSAFSTGFTIKDLEDYDTNRHRIHVEPDNFKQHADLLVYKFKNFTSSEIVYQFYKYLLEDNPFDFRSIKTWTKSSQSLMNLFNSEIGKEVMSNIFSKKIKSLSDVIAFLKDHDSKVKTRNRHLTVNDLEYQVKKYNSNLQTYFEDVPHYVCAVYVNDSIEPDIENSVEENESTMDFGGGQRAGSSQLYDLYKNRVTSHSATVAQGHFTLGWVRFSIKEINKEKVCIIDELQSDLKSSAEEFDKHKVTLPEETFDEFFGTTTNLYKLILQKFIYTIREEYGFGKIYAPTYDVKRELTKLKGKVDRERFNFLSDEDFEHMKNMTPPMFPYKEIIPSFGFTKVGSNVPGFLILEGRR